MTVTYSLNVANARLTGFSKLLTRWKGSIYKLLYREMAIYIGLYYSLSFLYRYILDEEQRVKFEKIVLYCEEFTNMVPLTFVLGFYVSIVVSRWWQQFMMIPWPDKSVMLITGHIHGNDERGRMIRRTLARYLMLMMTLTCQAVSTSVRRRFPTVDHLMDAGIMTKEERVIYDSIPGSHGKWWTPCAWFTTLVVRARKEGRIKDDVLLAQILDELHVYRNLCGMMFSYDWISIPLVYTQTVTIATYSYFLATLVGRQYLDPAKGYKKHVLDLYIPIFTIFEFFFFMGWLKVAEQLINPYGEDDDDFELNWCLDRNLIVSNWVVDELHNKAPKLVRDMYWDDQVPILPYTKSAFERKKGLASAGPHLGSAANLEIHPEESDFVPMETIMEEEALNYSSPAASPGLSLRGENVANTFDNVTVTNSTTTVVPTESDSQKGLWMGSRLLNLLVGQSNQSLNTTSRVSDSTRSLFRGSKANINAPFILKTPRKRLRTTSMRTNSSMQVSHPGGGDHLAGSISDDLPTAPVILPSAEQSRSRVGSRLSELRAQPGPDGFRFPASYTGSPSLALLRRNSPLNSSLGSRKSSGAESESVLTNQANQDAISNVTIDSTTSAQRTSQPQVVIMTPNESLDANDLPQELLYEPEVTEEEPVTAVATQSNRSSDESLTFTESNQSTVRSISELISKSGPKEP